MSKRYSLWWGDSCLCGNFEDLTDIMREIADRLDYGRVLTYSPKWLFDDAHEIRRAIEQKPSGVLLIGTTTAISDHYGNIPPRAYQVIWKEQS